MNRESISHYLRNPNKLVDISVSQIEKWLKESPYSQPLRALLAKKLNFNRKVVLDSAVNNASIIIGNRHWLYQELHKKDSSISENATNQNIIEENIKTLSVTAAAAALATPDIEKVKDTIEENIQSEIAEQHIDIDEIISKEVVTEDPIQDSIDVVDTVVENILDEDPELHIDVDENIPKEVATEALNQEPIDVEDEVEAVTEVEDEVVVELDFEVEFEEAFVKEKEQIELEHQEEIELDQEAENVKGKDRELVEDNGSNELNVPILEPSIATIDEVETELKVVDITAESESDLKIEYVATDEELISNQKKEKKAKKKKKKSDPKKKSSSNKPKKKEKKKKAKKEKESKTKKKSNKPKKDEKTTKKKDSAKKRKSKKDGKKKSKAQRKALLDYWDNKVGTITAPPSEKKKGKKKAKKKRKIKLTKVNVPVNTNGESANEYEENLNEMSSYTQWLLTFGKDKGKSSLKHMSSLKKKKRKNKIEEISFTKTKSKSGKSKKAKKKKKSKVKGKSKTDKSLKAKEEAISELWADLLAKQGHIKKARKMYLKLSLKYPEKSTYFAAKLENL